MKRSSVLPLLVAFGLLMAMVVGTLWMVAQQAESFGMVRHTLEVENRLSRVLSLLQDAETGQRGFLLTGRSAFLGPYDAAIGMIDGEVDTLAAATVDNPAQQATVAKLRKLYAERTDVLRRTIDLYRSGAEKAAVAPERLERGKALMDQIRVLVADMNAEEQRLLRVRGATAARQAALAKFGLALSAIALLALAIVSVGNARRQLTAALVAADGLRIANERLESEADIRRAAEAQVRQMQKMESIGQLTGGIAHDFNNMLAIVIGSLDLAKRRFDSEPTRAKGCIDNALEGARRAAELTSRLLAFSRQQPLEPRSIDANKLVGGMSELLRRTIGEQLRVETVLAGGLWPAFADSGQLENALLNLVVNARDAMPGGGKLTVETSNAHLDDAYAAAHSEVEPGQYVLVCVSDTGTGMPPEVVERVFDPFYTTKGVGKGTGLGLSQVYGFVKQSGGHIKIYSEPGHGTAVKLYLPRYVGPAVAVQTDEPVQSSTMLRARDNEVILVVEDDEKVRHLSVDSLRELGYTVVQASDGNQALAILTLQPRIDLLFTDIIMPDLNGRKLAERARQARPDLKVLYTTGYTRNAVVHNGVLDPGVAFIAKPFTFDQLAAKVRQVIGGGGVNRPI